MVPISRVKRSRVARQIHIKLKREKRLKGRVAFLSLGAKLKQWKPLMPPDLRKQQSSGGGGGAMRRQVTLQQTGGRGQQNEAEAFPSWRHLGANSKLFHLLRCRACSPHMSHLQDLYENET